METKEVLLGVQSLLALRLDYATERLKVEPGDFSNGYRAGCIDCLGVVNDLLKAVSDKVSPMSVTTAKTT